MTIIQKSTIINKMQIGLNHIEDCIRKVRELFLTYNLLINDNKTELILLESQFQLNKVHNIQIKAGNCTFYSKESEKFRSYF